MKRTLNFVAAIAFVLFSVNRVTYMVTGRDFDESSIYQIVYGFDAVNFSAFLKIIFLSILMVIVFLFIAISFHRLPVVRTLSRVNYVIIILVLMAYIGVNSVTIRVARALNNSFGRSDSAQNAEFVKRFKVVNEKLNLKKNIVFIYLESFERTYLDEQRFPGLAPNIARLEKSSDHFTEIAGLDSAGWTMGGMVASQCGFPLVTPLGSGNSMGRVGSFLSGATCIGDLLRAKDYRLEFIGGAPKNFAGKDKFYSTHGFHSVKGLEELKKEHEEVSEWGRFDNNTLDDVLARYKELQASGSPFGLFALTLDTHSPNGYMGPVCAGAVYGDGSNAMLNAVHCNDIVVSNFLSEIRSLPGGDNTVFVIGSDHLAMLNSASALLEEGDRRNLLMIFDGNNTKVGFSSDIKGTSLDIGATVLDYVTDGGVQKLGLGRSLRDASSKTLIMRETSADAVDNKIENWRNELLSFWQFATSLDDGFSAKEGRELVVGKASLAFPVAFDLTKNVINEIILEGTLEKTSELIASNREVLLIDSCVATSAHLRQKIAGAGLCFIYNDGFNRTFSGVLHDNEIYHLETLSANKPISPQKRSRFLVMAETGAYPEDLVVAKGALARASSFRITSSGFETGALSSVMIGATNITGLSRGLNFFSIGDDGSLEAIGNIDNCSGDPLSAIDIKSKMKDVDKQYVVVASDTAFCGPKKLLKGIFVSLGLEKFDELEFRAPYVAIWSNGMLQEFVGKVGSKLTIWSMTPKSMQKNG